MDAEGNPDGKARADAMGTRASSFDETTETLRRGEPAAFPTDTVYGVGVAAGAAASPDALFRLKRRPQDKPIAWLVESASDLDRYGMEVPELARAAARAFWPGGLTLIVNASDAVPEAFRSAQGTVGLRMPANERTLELIRAVGAPIAATSANFSHQPAPASSDEADPAFLAQLPAVLADGAAAPSGTASTVLDCTCEPPRILRQGAVSAEDLERLGEGCVERAASAGGEASDEAPLCGPQPDERFIYESHDGESQVAAYLWLPSDPEFSQTPRGIVQIAHGMCEHMLRYADFAAYLAGHGFAVCGNDHIGHGATQPDPRLRGCLPAHEGEDVLVEDVDALRELMEERFPGVPYFLFGHSMGSFIARVYLPRHGQGLAGAVICGTAFMPPMVSRLGSLFSRGVARVRGEGFRSTLLDSLGAGAYANQIEDARTPFDWLSTDPAVVDAYRADPRCGFMFSAGGYAVLTRLLADACSLYDALKVPKDLPILVVSGADDPVGSNGAGPRACAAQLRKAELVRVEEILYEGMRHEILNEPGHMRVYGDVLAWLEACCDEAEAGGE